MKHLFLLILTFVAFGCAEEPEDPITKYISCSGVDSNTLVSYCYSFTSTSLDGRDVKAVCDAVSGAQASVADCSTDDSDGTCSGITLTYAGKDINNIKARFYISEDADSQQASCLANSGTWALDSSGLVIKSTQFCEADSSCINLNGLSPQNAENLCNQINGYLDNNCK